MWTQNKKLTMDKVAIEILQDVVSQNGAIVKFFCNPLLFVDDNEIPEEQEKEE